MTRVERRSLWLAYALAAVAAVPLGFLAVWCVSAALDGVRHYGG